MARPKLLAALPAPLIGCGALALALLIPVHDDQRLFASLNLGLAVFAVVLLAVLLGAWAAGGEHRSATRIEAAAWWTGCGLTCFLAVAAVAASAETLDPNNIVLAQKYNGLYLVHEPVAAWIFLVAVAMTVQWRIPGILLLAVLSALGATLFLGGYIGNATLEGLPALLLKSAAVFAFIAALHSSLTRVSPSARLAIAWAGAGVGFLNLVITLIQLGP